MKTISFASVGTGWIASEFIKGAKQVNGLSYAACYSRNAQTAAAFAAENGAERIFTDLQELACSEEISAVYIASPNAFHTSQARLFLEHGKHVLCEKPIAIDPVELQELQALAAKKKRIYLEAMISMHLPEMKILEQAVKNLEGVSMARIDFSQYSSKYPAYLRGEVPNIFNPAMQTGGLYDLGIYCVYPLVHLFGEPEEVAASVRKLSTGADGCGAIVFGYPDMVASVTYSKTAQGVCGSEIQGEAGVISIPRISKLTDMTWTPLGKAAQPLSPYTEKYLQMSYEAQSFYDFISDPLSHAQRYEDLSNLSLAVCQTLRRCSI